MLLCDAGTDPRCPAVGWYSLNTQVVVSSSGALLSKHVAVSIQCAAPTTCGTELTPSGFSHLLGRTHARTHRWAACGATNRYHKEHLFISGDRCYDPNPAPAPVVFTAPFGVRFGQFICFDVRGVGRAWVVAVARLHNVVYVSMGLMLCVVDILPDADRVDVGSDGRARLCVFHVLVQQLHSADHACGGDTAR